MNRVQVCVCVSLAFVAFCSAAGVPQQPSVPQKEVPATTEKQKETQAERELERRVAELNKKKKEECKVATQRSWFSARRPPPIGCTKTGRVDPRDVYLPLVTLSMKDGAHPQTEQKPQLRSMIREKYGAKCAACAKGVAVIPQGAAGATNIAASCNASVKEGGTPHVALCREHSDRIAAGEEAGMSPAEFLTEKELEKSLADTRQHARDFLNKSDAELSAPGTILKSSELADQYAAAVREHAARTGRSLDDFLAVMADRRDEEYARSRAAREGIRRLGVEFDDTTLTKYGVVSTQDPRYQELDVRSDAAMTRGVFYSTMLCKLAGRNHPSYGYSCRN